MAVAVSPSIVSPFFNGSASFLLPNTLPFTAVLVQILPSTIPAAICLWKQCWHIIMLMIFFSLLIFILFIYVFIYLFLQWIVIFISLSLSLPAPLWNGPFSCCWMDHCCVCHRASGCILCVKPNLEFEQIGLFIQRFWVSISFTAILL